jgi:hypothetical protein
MTDDDAIERVARLLPYEHAGAVVIARIILDPHLREVDELFTENRALCAKLDSLAPHGTCGCSYDSLDALCDHHSPQNMKLRAENTLLREQLARGGVMAVVNELHVENCALKEALRAIGVMGCTKEGNYPTDWALIARKALNGQGRA